MLQGSIVRTKVHDQLTIDALSDDVLEVVLRKAVYNSNNVSTILLVCKRFRAALLRWARVFRLDHDKSVTTFHNCSGLQHLQLAPGCTLWPVELCNAHLAASLDSHFSKTGHKAICPIVQLTIDCNVLLGPGELNNIRYIITLERLEVSGCSCVDGDFLNTLGSLTNLHFLNVRDCRRLTDSALEMIADSAVMDLDLGGCQQVWSTLPKRIQVHVLCSCICSLSREYSVQVRFF